MPICDHEFWGNGYILWIPSGEVCSDSFDFDEIDLLLCKNKNSFAYKPRFWHNRFNWYRNILNIFKVRFVCERFTATSCLSSSLSCRASENSGGNVWISKGFTMAKLDGMRPTVTQYGSTCLVSLLHACRYPVYTLYHRIHYSIEKTYDIIWLLYQLYVYL